MRNTRAAWFLYQKLVFVLGGMLLPLEVLPGPMEQVARVLPFASMAYVAGRFASGHVELGLIGLQLLWLVVLGGLAWAAFGRGEERVVRGDR